MTVTIENLVSREVHYCVSYLVSTLAAGYGEIENGPRLRDRGNASLANLAETAEQAFILCAPIADYEETALQNGWAPIDQDPSEDRQEDGPCLYHADQDRVMPLGAWQDACEDLGLESGDGLIEREVYEHWIVSEWLADKLIERGEKVDKDFCGVIVWARTTTGQGIASDSVIEKIHTELVAS